jgi:hypothetical protein
MTVTRLLLNPAKTLRYCVSRTRSQPSASLRRGAATHPQGTTRMSVVPRSERVGPSSGTYGSNGLTTVSVVVAKSLTLRVASS